ncbi:MBL fold metallo-hydrolase [Oceanobacillus bengalensis]|uniref:MBL fold metallo-hydrolase n=1 Tax=Oceanobacillus bengalensis TaxID=1435466 RepID=A0A494Z5P8_9BACI|nr:MBL fold metallo-hydrolase [Oceanobacillus bengalensis]RKQ17814.1 MBL fold metallo-hydrolase [Oceanobacillus bengalensis]
MKVKVLPVGPIGTNCYLIIKDKEALIIDPGADADRIQATLSQEGIIPQAILLTHAHFDHIGAVDELRKRYKLELYLHELEHTWLGNPQLNGSLSLLKDEIIIGEAENKLKVETVQINFFTFDVIHTPGHSPGSVSFIFHDEQFIIGGDVLFRQGIGRTDLVGGDFNQLAATIRNNFYTLDEAYTVYPGHGPKTTIKHEKENNPFIR